MTATDTSTRVPSASNLGRPVRILLVEDSEADMRLTMAALRKAHVANEMFCVPNGEEAMAFLRAEPPYNESPRPDLVLLDLNMPRMDGREVLTAMKADMDLRRIPVVILTTSAEERDVVQSYDKSAAGYVIKPVDFADFVDVIRSLEGFWLSVVHFAPA